MVSGVKWDPVAIFHKRCLAVSVAISHPPIDVVISSGDRTTLECMAVGFPLPQISWNGRDAAVSLGSSNTSSGNTVTSRLQLVQMGAEAGGEYSCVGVNSVARVPSMAMAVVYGKFKFLHVALCQPDWFVLLVKPTAVVKPTTQTVLDGRLATVFQCIGSGYPAPSLSWQWSSIPSDPRVGDSYNVPDLINAVGSNLTIGLVSLLHNNTVYSCRASNSKGNGSALGHLTVKSKLLCGWFLSVRY